MVNPLLARLLRDAGPDYGPGVRNSKELDRIIALPQRDEVGWEIEHCSVVGRQFKREGGTQLLRRVQVEALLEMREAGGLVAPISVGGGKTLVSLLAAANLGSQRPVLLIPASNMEKTWRDIERYREHWAFPMPLLTSYQLLGHPKHADDLETFKPDLIVADEAHRLANRKAAVTRRVSRYLKARPGCRFVALSGTLIKKSLMSLGHIAGWALREGSPLPRTWVDLMDWERALGPDEEMRIKPGALTRLMTEQERADPDQLRAARSAFQRRLVSTPGVVVSPPKTGCGASIKIRKVRLWSSAIEKAITNLHRTWETPDGQPLTIAADVAAKEKQISLGFYYRFVERPPRDWLDARRDWARYAREKLAYSRTVDTEAQLIAKLAGFEPEELTRWLAVRGSFEPETVAEWISDAPAQHVSDWLREGPGIVWIEHRAFGERLSLEWPYHRENGLDLDGRHIETTPRDKVLASRPACGEGFNLQRWSRNLVTCPPVSAEIWEQLIGRTHRTGQEADEVVFDVIGDIVPALERARFLHQATGTEQKLLIADLEGFHDD